MRTGVRLVNILLAALVAGTVFGIWLGYDPAALSAPAYIEQQQNAIRALNVTMPVLGAITILLTLISAFLQRRQRATFASLMAAALLFVASGLVTRFGNQPINSIVMGWQAANPPGDWMALRDQWWMFHQIRTLTAVAGLLLVAWASVDKS